MLVKLNLGQNLFYLICYLFLLSPQIELLRQKEKEEKKDKLIEETIIRPKKKTRSFFYFLKHN